MSFKKGVRAIHPIYGAGVVRSKPLYGYANPANGYDSEAKYDFHPDGMTLKPRVFESELELEPVVPRKEKNALLQAVAIEQAKAKGWAMHLDREHAKEIVPADNPTAFEALATLAFRMGATLTLSAPASLAESLVAEMHNYVIPVSENSNHLKSNVALENSAELGALQREMGFTVHTNGYTNGYSEVEICSKELAKELGKRGVISERVLHKPVEEVNE
jgi:hypothetical protein